MKNLASHSQHILFPVLAALLATLCVIWIPTVVRAQDTSDTPSDVSASQVSTADATGGSQNVSGSGPQTVSATPVSCSGLWNFMSSPRICIGREIGAVIDGVLVSVASWLLTLAGSLFNWLVSNTIVEFGSVYTDTVKAAVETAWTAFRDIANILIIGIFTFIAISIVLGLKEFGQKKLIARVLIIAVLINFSLLFSKMIIDASNFIALQLYTAATGQRIGNTGENAGFTGSCAQGNTNSQCYGISGAFMDYMGVSGFSDTREAVSNLAESIDNGNVAFLHGFFAAAVLLGAAFVLFYGSFLLASRVILIVVLFVTASIAFASYLVPAWETSNYGWKVWKDSLLKSAIFAPILMLFLWMTLTVGYAMRAKGGTLGDLLANPTKTLDISALFSYLVILGLLFVSFKLSSSFAGKIAGFNFASLAPALGFGIGARLAAFAGRQTFGRAGLFIGNKLQERSQDQKRFMFTRQLYDFGAQGFKAAAKRDFNAARTPLGSAIQQTAGIKKLDTLAGKIHKGFEGTEKARAERYVDTADRMKLSKEERENYIKNARNAVLKADPEFAKRHSEANAVKEAAERNLKAVEQSRDAVSEGIARAVKPLQESVERMRQAAASSPGDAATQQRLRDAEQRLETERQRHQANLQQETDRIKNAKDLIQQSERGLANVERGLDDEAVRRGLRPKEIKQEAELAADITHNRFSNTLMRVAGLSTKENDRLTQMVKKGVGEHHEKKAAKKIAEYIKEKTGSAGHDTLPAPAAPPVPPAGGSAEERH